MAVLYKTTDPSYNKGNRKSSDVRGLESLTNLVGFLDLLIQIDLMGHYEESEQTKVVLNNIIKRDTNDQ